MQKESKAPFPVRLNVINCESYVKCLSIIRRGLAARLTSIWLIFTRQPVLVNKGQMPANTAADPLFMDEKQFTHDLQLMSFEVFSNNASLASSVRILPL